MIRQFTIALVITLIASSIELKADTPDTSIETKLVQIKHERLYFDLGRESRVFPGAIYELFQSDSLILTGSIEASMHGISYSAQLPDSLIDQLTLMTRARIYPAKIDTTRPIRIGIATNIPGRSDTIASHDSVYVRYDSPFQMAIDFRNGLIDGYLSYSKPENGSTAQQVQSSPAPFIVAILPYLSETNKQSSFISTALYYRFDSDNPHFYFDGDGLIPHDCLTLPLESCTRLYPYSPRRCSSLLETLSPRIDTIKMQISDRLLQNAATYFSDILSRERIRTYINTENSDAHVLLTTVPYDNVNPLPTLRQIHKVLSDMPFHKTADNESLTLVAHYLDEVEKDMNTDVARHYLRLAQSELRDNLGVFPLLQPTLYFVSTEVLSGFRFEKRGFPDFSNSVLLKLPEHKKETER